MSEAARDLDRALRRLHRGVLASLGVCAVLAAGAAAAESGDSDPAPPLAYLAGAVALAGISIVAGAPARRGRRLSRRTLAGLIASLLAAAALGLLGVALAVAEGLGRAGLLYTVAGLLLAIRPPPAANPTTRRP